MAPPAGSRLQWGMMIFIGNLRGRFYKIVRTRFNGFALGGMAALTEGDGVGTHNQRRALPRVDAMTALANHLTFIAEFAAPFQNGFIGKSFCEFTVYRVDEGALRRRDCIVLLIIVTHEAERIVFNRFDQSCLLPVWRVARLADNLFGIRSQPSAKPFNIFHKLRFGDHIHTVIHHTGIVQLFAVTLPAEPGIVIPHSEEKAADQFGGLFTADTVGCMTGTAINFTVLVQRRFFRYGYFL